MAIVLTVFSCSQSFCLGFSFILSPSPFVIFQVPIGLQRRPFDSVVRLLFAASASVLFETKSISLPMRSVEKCTIGVGWNSRKSCLLFVSPW